MPFLLLVGIVSDAVGLIVLELRYPIADVHSVGIVLVMAAITGAIVLRRCEVRNFWPYVLGCGGVCWCGLFLTGLHPALALVPIVPFLPGAARDRQLMVDARPGARDPLSRFHRTWKYPVHVVLFLFGLTNAGVIVRGVGTGTWAVAVAALAGRPAGMLLALAIAVAAGLRLPRSVGWRDMVVVAFASSIGFTVALFFATVTFPVGPVLNEVKLGALLTVGVSLPTIAVAKVLRVGRFARRVTRRPVAAPEYAGV
jgi:NhaA family Na+:H+ antiporter